MTGIYAAHAPAFVAAGLPCFPVNTRRKRPAVRNWQRATARSARKWAERFGEADGLGVLLGARSRLTEIDVDVVGDAALGAAIERFGETPIIIRTASGKSKLWFRHSGERRRIRPIPGEDLDVLGDGFTVAPPSWREDLGAAYHFVTGSLADLDRLPTIRPGAFDARPSGPAGTLDVRLPPAAEAVQRGERNTRLWRWCMTEARSCDDVETLIDAAETWASAMPEPLDLSEIERCARSAWRYEEAGRNYLGLRRPQVTAADVAREALRGEPVAFVMWHEIAAYHSNREAFAIAPRAWAPSLGLPWKAVARGRDVLLERGLIVEIEAPDRGKQRAGRYRLTSPIMSKTGHNHLTPSPSLSLP